MRSSTPITSLSCKGEGHQYTASALSCSRIIVCLGEGMCIHSVCTCMCSLQPAEIYMACADIFSGWRMQENYA